MSRQWLMGLCNGDLCMFDGDTILYSTRESGSESNGVHRGRSVTFTMVNWLDITGEWQLGGG